MKKWIFITGLLICGILFFISGSLVGYSIYDKQVQTAETKNEKPKRKPIVSNITSPLIGRIVDKQTNILKMKTRLPTTPAIQKAQTYKSMLF